MAIVRFYTDIIIISSIDNMGLNCLQLLNFLNYYLNNLYLSFLFCSKSKIYTIIYNSIEKWNSIECYLITEWSLTWDWSTSDRINRHPFHLENVCMLSLSITNNIFFWIFCICVCSIYVYSVVCKVFELWLEGPTNYFTGKGLPKSK